MFLKRFITNERIVYEIEFFNSLFLFGSEKLKMRIKTD